MASVSLRSRFQGALVGAVVGDCLGSYWEMMSWRGTHPIGDVEDKLKEQTRQAKSGKAPLISYTDDSAMTLAMAKSLIDSNGFNSLDMAKKFTEEYFSDPSRGYGQSVSTVFVKLQRDKYSDVFLPAQQQFQGEGSCGNGAAMRASPAALYGYKDDEKLIESARVGAKITHAHISGVCGALLQAMAVKLALGQAPGTIKPVEFVDSLSEKIRPFEEEEKEEELEDSSNPQSMEMSDPSAQSEALSEQSSTPDPKIVPLKYLKNVPTCVSRLQQVRALLLQPDPPSADDVEQLLGHGVLAHEAVPCALYAFLHCSKQSFRELIPFAISLGGDTDTIASMAGAVGGAYWGVEAIPEEWTSCCESMETARKLADSLYELAIDKISEN